MAKSYSELLNKYNELKAKGKTLSTSKEFAKIDKELKSHPIHNIVSTIQKEIVALDRQLDQLGALGLTDTEKQAFLDKAIEQVQPYYDRKTSEIQQGIDEGRIRTAEDNLLLIREVEQETKNALEQFDLNTAQTEEEFLNRLGFITAGADEDVAFKTEEWRQRLESLRFSQIQSGVFSSGIGEKKRLEQERLKQMELDSINRQEQEALTQAETSKEYNLENIRLAREAAQNKRERLIGAPQQTDAMKSEALTRLGYSDMGQLPSETEIMELRNSRGISPIFSGGVEKLNDLEAERRKALEGRSQELQQNELAVREQQAEAERKRILAQRAEKASKLNTFGI